MKHKDYKDLIQLLLFGELNIKEKNDLENHLAQCEECKEEFDANRRLLSVLSEQKTTEPDEKLLNEARSELRSALRLARKKTTYSEAFISIIGELFKPKYKFAATLALMLIIGVLLGRFMFVSSNKIDKQDGLLSQNNTSIIQSDVQVSNVRLISPITPSGEIEFTFDAVKPMRVKGSIKDEKIKNILMYSMLNGQNPGLRLNSINAINADKNKILDADVKHSLLSVVKYDNNAGVRMEALKLLQKFPYDDELKQAYLVVLAKDPNSAMRIEAMNNLVKGMKAGYQFNEGELTVFKQKMQHDDNNYVRNRAQLVLKENM